MSPTLSVGATLLSGLVLASACSAAPILAQYTFTDNLLTPSTRDAAVTATPVTAAPKVNNNTVVNVATSNGFYTSAPFLAVNRNSVNESNTRSNVYFYITLSATGADRLNFEKLSFKVAQGGGSIGDRNYDVRYMLGNNTTLSEATLVPITNIPSVRPTFTTIPVDLSGTQFDAVSMITFRFGFNTLGFAQNVDYDDITFEGTVVPEPAAASALIGVALLGRRRNRR